MTPAAGRRPAEVARELGVSPSTLRRWSQQFGDLLSPEAGSPTPQPSGKIAHRRYASEDVETLQRVRDSMQQGLTAEEIRTQLTVEITSEPEPEVEIEFDDDPVADVSTDGNRALVLDSELDEAIDIGRLVSDTLSSLSDSQRIILGGQQTAKQLLGVLLQDNFNLKDENVRLRERMVDTERRVYEMKRELDNNRSQERDRMRQMEAHLFDLQRRLDALAQQRATMGQPVLRQPNPVPVVAPAQAPAPAPIPAVVAVAVAETPEPIVVEEMLVEPEPMVADELAPQPEEMAAIQETPDPMDVEMGVEMEEEVVATKRGFWAWLWGK